jgi:hypothetical protein
MLLDTRRVSVSSHRRLYQLKTPDGDYCHPEYTISGELSQRTTAVFLNICIIRVTSHGGTHHIHSPRVYD